MAQQKGMKKKKEAKVNIQHDTKKRDKKETK
jgi:hypothetical protein